MTEQKLYQFCDTMAASEYRSLIRPFLDISTLSARLKAEECISTEYHMFYPQLGVKFCSMAGGGVQKSIWCF